MIWSLSVSKPQYGEEGKLHKTDDSQERPSVRQSGGGMPLYGSKSASGDAGMGQGGRQTARKTAEDENARSAFIHFLKQALPSRVAPAHSGGNHCEGWTQS